MKLALIGDGAISRSLQARVSQPIAQVVKRGERLRFDVDLVVECAGHGAIHEHVLPALLRGIPCAVLSIGALSEIGLPEQLKAAAEQGKTQCHLVSGAVGAIDALASAKHAGLNKVVYRGRKPPKAWQGSPAEQVLDLASVKTATVFLSAHAREAARLYPKNANVAATIALAGLGFEETEVELIADPTVNDNIHELSAYGAFGELHLRMIGKPLPDNPKTSTLTVLSALRFIHNQTSALTI